jgi:dipeptidyl aminopeptidase/acylaminoacyl peptidase
MWGEQRAASYLNLQLFASRGYAVFVPNSTLRVGHPMRDIADVILPGADKIVAMGISDPSRLGVYGLSYGGYTTLSLLVQTNRFKAAVASSGVFDLITDYGYLHSDGSDWTGGMESEQGRMGGTPWQYRTRYIENSPFFYLDRVQTPVLLEYGDLDEAVAPYNSRMTFVALRRLGKTAMLVGYANEGHILFKTSNQIDFTNRMLNWFAKYLQ